MDRFSLLAVKILLVLLKPANLELKLDKTLTTEVTENSDGAAPNKKSGIERMTQTMKCLLGMSRAPVAIFVVAHAGLASIFALGRLPDFSTIVIGVVACLAGTGALIGLNDLLDVDLDRRRIEFLSQPENLDLGSTFIHHPVAKGIISMRVGIIWTAALSIVSLVFITRLRTDLWPIFMAIAVCVFLYSKLSEISFLKFLAVATAVTLGALAGWFAVFGSVNATFILFTVWSFTWEIGGRNIPNDFNDLEEDRPLGIKTIPVVFGPTGAARVVFAVLIVTFVLSALLVMSTAFSPVFKLAVPLLGIYLLLIPAYGLLAEPRPETSQKLYNRSAIYPLLMLVVLMGSLYI